MLNSVDCSDDCVCARTGVKNAEGPATGASVSAADDAGSGGKSRDSASAVDDAGSDGTSRDSKSAKNDAGSDAASWAAVLWLACSGPATNVLVGTVE